MIAISSLFLRTVFDEYKGMYSREMQVFAVGSWWSWGGLIVTEGLGWNPSSLDGNAGLDVQKYTWKKMLAFSTTLEWEQTLHYLFNFYRLYESYN